MFPLLSIIIPVYNNEKYLEKCLNSIINQTYKNTEIIAIDDSSNDNSYKILQDFANKDSRIKIIKNLKNSGAGKTKNLGLELAKGEYIFFIDSDDYIELNTLEILINKVLEIDADFIGYNLVRVNEKTLEKSFCKAKDFNDKYFQSMSACTKIYKRLFLLENKIKFHPIRSAEDMIMAFKVFALAEKYDWLDFNGYFYIQREHSLTKIKKNKKDDDLLINDIFYSLTNINLFLNSLPFTDKSQYLKLKFSQININYLFAHYKLRDISNKEIYYKKCIQYLDNNEEEIKKFKSEINKAEND